MNHVAGAVLALSALTACTAPSPATPREPTDGAAHFKVMTYNIHRDRWNDASTVEAVGASDADILCLQEVNAAWEQVLRARYASTYPYMLFVPRENMDGLGVLSRYPLEDHGVIQISDWHPGWLVQAETPAGRVQLVHVHLRALFDGAGNPVSSYVATSRDHVTQMQAFMDGSQPHMPTIVLGDFNEEPSADAVRMLEGRGFVNLLPMFRPGQFTWAGKTIGLDSDIDHILIDDSFEALDAFTQRRGASDHLPVTASIELKPTSGGAGQN